MDGLFIIAVHSLVYLSHTGVYTSSRELAENICTNSARVRLVMSKLSASGLVETREGKSGGYRIQGDAGRITLGDVAEALKSSFASPSWESRDFNRECLISTHMKDEMEALGRKMDGVLYSFLDGITVRDIEKEIMTRYNREGDRGGSDEKQGESKGGSGTE